MNARITLTGGCLCGQIRYAVDATSVDAGFCHCTRCQRASGAPTVAWLTIPTAGFRYTQGQAQAYRSSERFQREFCGRCGTQLVFRAQRDPETVDVTLCSLDDSDQITPQYHIWCGSRVHWLHLDDDLPQYADGGPDI